MMKDIQIMELAQKLFEKYPYDNPQKLLTLAEEWLRAVDAWKEARPNPPVDFVSAEVRAEADEYVKAVKAHLDTIYPKDDKS